MDVKITDGEAIARELESELDVAIATEDAWFELFTKINSNLERIAENTAPTLDDFGPR